MKLNGKILAEISGRIFSGGRGQGVGGSKGIEVREVGDVAQDVLEAWNEENGTQFSIIKGLSGHVLGRNKIHAGVTISNYRNENGTVLDDVAFAIEPFVTSGVGDIYEGPVGGIYILENDKPVRDRDARLVLKYIKEKFVGRPFCIRFLVKEFDKLSINRLKFILGGLVRAGILHEYPMLIEKSRKPISQFENTFVVTKEGVRCTTV